jgi:hypothetical protein
MVERVHIISVRGAKETIIRATASATPMNNVFYPIQNMPPLNRSMHQAVVLVNYSNVPNTPLDGMHGPLIDGFTFQGGDIQVYARAEAHMEGRVSNCCFDMRFHEKFGVLVVSVYDQGLNPPGYHPAEFVILNNTFIQNWVNGPNPEPQGVNNIGICNVNDPLDEDPNQQLRGVNALLIHNNCIRSLPSDIRTSMLGIDDSDTRAVSSGWSNAFIPGTARSFSGQYQSLIMGAVPQPKVALTPVMGGGLDPAFVGEMINSRFGILHPNHWVRDFRILPTSPLVDQGIAMNSSGAIINTNGIVYQEYSYPPQTDYINDPTLDPRWQIGSFLWDGEGYGNPRIVDSSVVPGNSVDIGFDETDIFCVAGSYGNDSRSHNQSCQPGVIPNGDATRHMIFPDQGRYWLYVQAGNIGLGWHWIPGTWPPSLTNQSLNWLYLVQPGIGNYYIDPLYWIQAIAAAIVYPDGWINPIDNKPYTFGHSLLTTDPVDPLPCQVLNQQVIFENMSLVYTLSNLQSEYY